MLAYREWNVTWDPFEVYVLCAERSVALADRLLAELAPSRSPTATEFPYPRLVDHPRMIFADAQELIQKLETETNESYSIYWDVESGVVDQIMLFFTSDGGMIVGLGGPRISPEMALSALQKIVHGQYGYVTSCSCPPDSINQFVSICERATLVNLFEGVVRLPNQAM